jgi:LEA14-like dessication related protein
MPWLFPGSSFTYRRRLAVIMRARLCFRSHMKPTWFRIAFILSCLFVAAGCGTALKLGSVLVTITEYQPTAADAQARLKLRFSNENVFPLAIANTDGKLYLNGTYVGKIELKEAVGVPSLAAVSHEAILHIENAPLLRQLRTTTAKTISYRLEIKMLLDVDEEKEKIVTVSSGEIDATSVQAAASEQKK